MRTRVKICGITRPEDAAAAVALGADALGFVFYRGSRRAVTPERAGEIIAGLPPFVTPVGVFAEAPLEEILRSVERAGIRCLQLHGDIALPDAALASLQVIRAFRTSPALDEGAVVSCRAGAVLLDGYSPQGPGGTGTLADWTTAARIAGVRRLILSGGLRPSNVAEAIGAVAPWAVDVSSGVESSPGMKDRALMAEFFRAVRSASDAAGPPLS